MNNPQKKPMQKIVAIKGSREEDVVHDADLLSVSLLQAASWQAEGTAQRAISQLGARILQGARVESSNWYFDRDLRMVRSRKESKAAGEYGYYFYVSGWSAI